MPIRWAATTASRSTSACAPEARGTAMCSPAMFSSATRVMHRSARARATYLPNAPNRRSPSSFLPISRRKRSWTNTNRGAPFARRVDLLRLAELGKRILVFVSHPWGGGIRRYMNDLVALTDARCEVLFLEPAVGDTVKLSWPRSGESFALYFTLPAELPMLAETLRTIGVERLHFHHIHLQPRAILELPALIGVAVRLHAARLPSDLSAVSPGDRGRPLLRRTRCRRLRGVPGATARPVGNRHHHVARQRSDACCAARAGSLRRRRTSRAGCAAISRNSPSTSGPIRKGPARRCRASSASRSWATCRPRKACRLSQPAPAMRWNAVCR